MTIRSTTINLLQTKEIGDLKIRYLAGVGTNRATVTLTFSDGKSEPAVLTLNQKYTVSHANGILSSLGLTSKPTYGITLREVQMNGTWRYIKVEVDDGRTVTQYGAIRFVTSPTGAKVYIDGHLRPGKTPCTQSHIKVGTHDIKLEYNGAVYNTKVTVNEYNNNDNPVPVSYNFANQPGSIYVVSSPGGAYVSIDGVRQTGTTPRVFNNIKTGSRRVRIELSGMAAQEQVVNVASGKQTNVAFTFKTTGQIVCTSSPTGADIYLDGILQKAKTPATITGVRYGKHTVEFRRAGYQSKSVSVTVPGGGSVTASTTLIQAILTTKLTIAPSVSSVAEGTQMKFTGRLLTTDNKPIAGARILFYKDTTINTQLKNSGTVIQATTDKFGNYTVIWNADNSNLFATTTHYFYATYAGVSGGYKSCRSDNCKVTITPQANQPTKITLTVSPTSARAGTTIKFAGVVRHATKNTPIPGAKLKFYWVRTGWPDSPLKDNNVEITATTNNLGQFTATWMAQDLDGQPDTDSYGFKAVVQKTPIYGTSESKPPVYVSISPGTGSFECVTTPSGATVLIDGKQQSGVTPRTYTGISVGKHSIEFRLQGYQNYSIPVATIATNGAKTTVSAKLIATIKDTVLTLNSPGASTTVGTRLPLTGTLRDSTGKPVPNVTIEFYKQNSSVLLDKPLMNENVALKATTNSTGLFTASWVAADMNLTGTASHKIYAKFAGNSLYKADNSNILDIAVNPKIAATTVLQLKASTSAALVDTPVVLSGTLRAANGQAVPNATIRFYDQTYPVAETTLKNGSAQLTATTNSLGAFSVQWNAKMMLPLVSSDPLNIVAKYAGSVDFKAATSNEILLTVSSKEAVTPTLSLTVSPSTVEVDGTVTMSGYLLDPVQNKGIANAKVSLLDKDDVLNLTNDTLATLTTDSRGNFTYQWKAAHETWMNSSKSTIEVYARFDGTQEYRKTTSNVRVVTIQTVGKAVLFDSSPVGANVDIDGTPAKDIFGPRTVTPLSVRIKDGNHTAKFYFTAQNSPGSEYESPITVQFNVSASGVTVNGTKTNGSVTAMWESESVCTKLGIPLTNCTNNPIIFMLDLVIPLRSITKILTGKDVDGKPATAGKLDYTCAALFFLPVGKVTSTFGKLGLKASSKGSAIAEAVTKNPRLADVLNDALFFNRVGAMTDSQIDEFMSMISKIRKKSATLAELDEISDLLAKVPATEVSMDVLNAMKTQLLKVFPDQQAARVLELMRRTVPTTEYGKEIAEQFGEFIAGTAVPSVDDMARLMDYANTNPDDMITLMRNLGKAQVDVVIKKLKLLGPTGDTTSTFLNVAADVVFKDNQLISDRLFHNYGTVSNFVSSLGKFHRAALNDATIQKYAVYLPVYLKRLSETQYDALYRLEPTVAQGVAEDIIRMFNNVAYTGYKPAEVVKSGLDKACAHIISKPELLRTATSKIQNVLDATQSMAKEITNVADTSTITTATEILEDGLNVIRSADSTVSYSALGNTFEAFTKASRFKYSAAKTAATSIADISKSALDEMVELPTNKGQLVSKYSGFTPEAISARVAGVLDDIPASASNAGSMVKEGMDEILASLHSAAEALRKGGIFVDESTLQKASTTTKKILSAADNIVSPTTPSGPIVTPIKSVLDNLFGELNKFSKVEQQGSLAVLNNIIDALDEASKMVTSGGTKLTTFMEFRHSYVLSRFADEMAELATSQKTAKAVQGIADDIVDNMDEMISFLKSKGITIKDAGSVKSPILKDIFKKLDDVDVPTTPKVPDIPTVPDVPTVPKPPEAVSDFVKNAVDFFNKLEMGYSLKISRGTIDEIIERTISDPGDMIKVVDEISVSRVMDNLMRYGNDGKFLSTYIRTIKGITAHQTQLGEYYQPFVAATGKAAKRLLQEGGDYKQLDTMWDAMFDGFGAMKKFDEILGTKYYRELYLTVNQLGATSPKAWMNVLTNNLITRYLKRLTPKTAGGKAWMLWAAYEITYLLLKTAGIAPGDQKYTVKDKIYAIREDVRALDNQCTWTMTPSYEADLEALRLKIEDLEKYTEDHKWALAWSSGAATPDRADAGIYSTAQYAIKGAKEDYDAFLKKEDCKSMGGSSGTTPSSLEDLKYEVSDRVSDMKDFYFQANSFCTSGDTEGLKKAIEDYKGMLNSLIAFNAKHTKELATGDGWLEGKMKVANGYLAELEACLNGEGTTINAEDLKWKLNDYRDELNDQYWYCDDLCKAGDSGLEAALEDFKDLVDELQAIADEMAADIEALGYTGLVEKSIERARGQIGLLSACTGTGSGGYTSGDIRSRVDDLVKNMETISYKCWELRDKGMVDTLNELLVTYESMISELQSIATDNADDVAAIGYTDYVDQQLGIHNASYKLYSEGTYLPGDSYESNNSLADIIDSDIGRLNGYYWDCVTFKKAGDTTNFNESMTSYEEILEHLKEILSSQASEVEAIGYTYEINQAIKEHTSKINSLNTSTPSGSGGSSSGSGSSGSKDDSGTSGGYYTNETYDSAMSLMDKIESSSSQGWELCKSGKKSALQQTLKTYTANLNSLKKLYSNHKAELDAAGISDWVSNDITYHTGDLQKLTNCASSSSSGGSTTPTEDPTEEPTDTGTSGDVIDEIDQYLSEMDDLYYQGLDAANTTDYSV